MLFWSYHMEKNSGDDQRIKRKRKDKKRKMLKKKKKQKLFQDYFEIKNEWISGTKILLYMQI